MPTDLKVSHDRSISQGIYACSCCRRELDTDFFSPDNLQYAAECSGFQARNAHPCDLCRWLLFYVAVIDRSVDSQTVVLIEDDDDEVQI